MDNLNIIKPFKGREIDYSKNVEIYRCLTKMGRVYSIRQGGKVVGHTSQLKMTNAKFVVQKAGQDRCKVTKARNVHAFVRGKIYNENDKWSNHLDKVTYCPYNDTTFIIHLPNSLEEITESDTVVFSLLGVFSDKNTN